MRVNKTVAIRTLDPEHLGQGEGAGREGKVGWGTKEGVREAGAIQVFTLTLQGECRRRMCLRQTSVTKCQTQTLRPEFFCKVRWPLPCHAEVRAAGSQKLIELHLMGLG